MQCAHIGRSCVGTAPPVGVHVAINSYTTDMAGIHSAVVDVRTVNSIQDSNSTFTLYHGVQQQPPALLRISANTQFLCNQLHAPAQTHLLFDQPPAAMATVEQVAERELNAFIQQLEAQHTHTFAIQRKISDINDTCYTSCVTAPYSGDQLTGQQQQCIKQCAQAYVNSSKVLQKLLNDTLSSKK